MFIFTVYINQCKVFVPGHDGNQKKEMIEIPSAMLSPPNTNIQMGTFAFDGAIPVL